MKENNTYRQAIASMPQHRAPENLWENIEQRLSSETDLSLKLPQHNANAELWSGIESALDKQQNTLKIKHFVRWTAAAAVIMLLFIPLNNSQLFKRGDKLVTTEELLIPVNGQVINSLNLEEDILACCSQNPEVCESPDFNNLNNMLNQLKTEKTHLIQLSNEMNDPSITDYINKVNSNIAQVQRKLLSMF